MTIEREKAVEQIGTEPCPCGHRSCKKTFLTGIGSFVQGSGFDPEEAHRIVTAVNSHAALLEALKGWQKLHADMVEAGGDLGCLPDGLIDRFALVQRDLMEKTDAAIALATADVKGE